jgi:hypothetical protein
MAHNRIQMPQFASVSGTGPSWSEVDNLDVDVLAEYLLSDDAGLTLNGVTFDFK